MQQKLDRNNFKSKLPSLIASKDKVEIVAIDPEDISVLQEHLLEVCLEQNITLRPNVYDLKERRIYIFENNITEGMIDAATFQRKTNKPLLMICAHSLENLKEVVAGKLQSPDSPLMGMIHIRNR